MDRKHRGKNHYPDFADYQRWFFANKLWYEHADQWREVLQTCHAHWNLDRAIKRAYIDRQGLGVEPTLALCRQQIELAPRAKAALEDHFNFKRDYSNQAAIRFRDQYPWKRLLDLSRSEPGFQLPMHRGFKLLASISGRMGDFNTAIDVCRQAQEVGWPGDWDVRIARYQRRLDNQSKQGGGPADVVN